MSRGGSAVFMIAAALSAPSAFAADAPRPSGAKDVCPARDPVVKAEDPAAPAAAGLVVFRDPVTGQIRQPSAAEIRSILPPEKPQAPRTLVTKTGPNGAVGIVLDSSFDSYLVVTKKPDGKLAMDCVTGEKKAELAIAGTSTPAKTIEARKEPLDVQ